MITDKGYDSEELRQLIRNRLSIPIIPIFSQKKCKLFHVTGKYQGNSEALIATFLPGMGVKIKSPDNWMVAFELLTNNLKRVLSKRKLVLFFDELP
jgi:hypothetical protein